MAVALLGDGAADPSEIRGAVGGAHRHQVLGDVLDAGGVGERAQVVGEHRDVDGPVGAVDADDLGARGPDRGEHVIGGGGDADVDDEALAVAQQAARAAGGEAEGVGLRVVGLRCEALARQRRQARREPRLHRGGVLVEADARSERRVVRDAAGEQLAGGAGGRRRDSPGERHRADHPDHPASANSGLPTIDHP